VVWLSASRALAEAARPSSLRSQGLKMLIGGLPPEARPQVLDLGAPLAANVEFLSALGCRVRIADLQRSLSVEPAEKRAPEAIDALFERLLPLAPGERFDAILAWDVFDYMRPHEVSALVSGLAPACRPEAPVLILVSTRREVPATPLRYRILDADTIGCEGAHEPARACPRYTQHDLGRLMAGFSVRRSVVQRGGIQEYLFVRVAAGEPGPPRPGRSSDEGAPPRPWFRRRPV
jgi:hypothetical protein